VATRSCRRIRSTWHVGRTEAEIGQYVVEWVRNRFGSPGVLVSAAGLGLTDMDALTYAMTRFAADTSGAPTAARALAVGLLANTLLKLALVLVIGGGAFRRTAGVGLAALAVASLAALLGLRPKF
jgi:uncharacterized membrane protein (DUF4010 family)